VQLAGEGGTRAMNGSVLAGLIQYSVDTPQAKVLKKNETENSNEGSPLLERRAEAGKYLFILV
jgi:hypothetical protein